MKLETWKRAQNLQVATRDEGAFVGRLDDFQFDLETHRIYGWRIKGQGVFAKAGGVRASELLLVGRDLAIVTTEDVIEWSGGKANSAEGRAWASSYRGTQAITRRGSALGAVQDFVIDRGGNQVTGFLLHGGRLLPLDQRVKAGPAAVIIQDQGQVVELPEEGGDERDDWWVRLKAAVGVGDTGSKPPTRDDPPALSAGEE